MKKLNRVGFFKELRHGDPDGPSLVLAKGKLSANDTSQVAEYLKSGQLLVATPGLTRDILHETSSIIGAPHILTDGEWAWPADLEHYVRLYRVGLPAAFLEHMKDAGWQIPDVNLEKIRL